MDRLLVPVNVKPLPIGISMAESWEDCLWVETVSVRFQVTFFFTDLASAGYNNEGYGVHTP